MTSPPALALVVGSSALLRCADARFDDAGILIPDEGGFSGSDDSDDNSGSNGDDDSGDDGTSSEDEGEDEPKAKKPTKGSAAISAKNLPRNPRASQSRSVDHLEIHQETVNSLEFIEDESDDENSAKSKKRKAGDTDEEPAAKKRKAGDGVAKVVGATGKKTRDAGKKKKTADDDDNYDFPVGPPRGKKKASEQLTKPKKNALPCLAPRPPATLILSNCHAQSPCLPRGFSLS
ncbi:hypothetical protein B0H10DRAFT_2237804 [Mycena sp. CBHHK59/15]|nr:hypothetical protein B0H10DRAFT_2237804 [Mycena sp. CBHHK59/15]